MGSVVDVLGGAVKIRCVTKIDTPHGVNTGLTPPDALVRILRKGRQGSLAIHSLFLINLLGEEEETSEGRKNKLA